MMENHAVSGDTTNEFRPEDKNTHPFKLAWLDDRGDRIISRMLELAEPSKPTDQDIEALIKREYWSRIYNQVRDELCAEFAEEQETTYKIGATCFSKWLKTQNVISIPQLEKAFLDQYLEAYNAKIKRRNHQLGFMFSLVLLSNLALLAVLLAK